MTRSATVTPGGISTPGTAISNDGFFRHHGIWALGVRLFRTLQFRSKALIVSVTFVLPILVLAQSLWSSTQETIDFAARERGGVVILRSLMPVIEDVLGVRNATRSMLGGFDASGDYREVRERTDKRIAALKQSVVDTGDLFGIAPAVAKLEAAWRTTAQSTNGADGQGRPVFEPVTTTLVAILAKIGDDANLVLDPDIDSFYLVNAMVLSMPEAAENVGQVWGWGTFSLSKGGLEAPDAKRLGAWSINAATKLAETRAFFDRAEVATPALKAKLDLAPIDAALAYQKDGTATLDAGKGDARKFYAEGLAATTGLFKLYANGLAALDELLVARIDGAQQARNVRFAGVGVCLLLGGYLFYAFFLVTQGGLNEVQRHLEAMSVGDLTTHPNPWGKDEAAALMLSLKDVQASLRQIVSRVRGSSDAIVHASSEIAEASMDLSSRTEQTAASLEESASSMEEIAATVKHTADSVREAAEVAAQNAEAAARGGAVIGKVVSTMQEINDLVEEDRRHHRHHRRHRVPDQYPGAQRRGRGGTSR